jgi:hypothetical protein
MTSQARIRLVSEGVVASYIHAISARAYTADVRPRDDAVLAADDGYSVFIPYPPDTEGPPIGLAREADMAICRPFAPISRRPLHHCGE